ncbi:activating signal cointegrator 1 isoform X2 [Calliopsis andreniformis]
MEIQNEKDLREFLNTFLDYTNPKHKQFVAELKKRQATTDQAGYRKVNDKDNVQKRQNERKKGKAKAKEKQEIKQETIKEEKVEKKKTKFVNLYSQDGKDKTTILLKGRHKCDCEAKKHSLINNCLSCGRIVCVQEGAGPCFCCGELVCSLKEQAILSSNSKQAGHLYNKLVNQKPTKNLEESIKQRNKLLEYDRSGFQGTKVIDDECDYYQTNNIWLSSKEREKLKMLEEKVHAQKHMSRLGRKVNVTFDFAGREVVEENIENNYNDFDEEQLQDILESLPMDEFDCPNICPDIEFNAPVYVQSNESESRRRNKIIPSRMKNIIQDKEYLEMSDAGLCLSMHQPYASLLVAGIKMHEGRTWYTSHRGRLWIASTSKQINKEEISRMEHAYRILRHETIKFPDNYPTGCLLGCVTVSDVLSQEEYKKVYPDGESDSPFIFICENFYSLPIKIPIQGKHKIYKLDQKIHQAALKLLEKFPKGLNN